MARIRLSSGQISKTNIMAMNKKNAPPEIELYLSNFRGALHWSVLFLKTTLNYLNYLLSKLFKAFTNKAGSFKSTPAISKA